MPRHILLIFCLILPAAVLGQTAGTLTMPLVEQRLASLRESGSAADSEIVVAYEKIKSLLVQVESHNQDTAHFIETMPTAPQREAEIQARIDTIDKDVRTDEGRTFESSRGRHFPKGIYRVHTF